MKRAVVSPTLEETMAEELLAVEDMAQRYPRLRKSWWYSKVAQQAIPFRKVGKYVLFSPEEIAEFFAAQKRGPGITPPEPELAIVPHGQPSATGKRRKGSRCG
jgi:hypothetical protein